MGIDIFLIATPSTSNNQLLMETNNTGAVQAAYTYGNDLIAMNRADANSYYHYDGLGSTRQLTNSAGVLAVSYTYDGFGNLIASTGTSDNVYGFTGEQQFEEAEGLVFLRARYYKPSIGRFISRDPMLTPMHIEDNFTWALPSLISQPEVLHPYIYCGNNPVNQIDPKGLYKWDGPVDPVTKGLCLILKPIPYFNCGARALETGRCNGMLQRCSIWCLISGDVDDNEREDCDKKCRLEHLACVSRGMRKKCAFKFRIQG